MLVTESKQKRLFSGQQIIPRSTRPYSRKIYSNRGHTYAHVQTQQKRVSTKYYKGLLRGTVEIQYTPIVDAHARTQASA